MPPGSRGSKFQEAPGSSKLRKSLSPIRRANPCASFRPPPHPCGRKAMPREYPGREMTASGDQPHCRERKQLSGARPEGVQDPQAGSPGRNVGSCLAQLPLPGAREPRFGWRQPGALPGGGGGGGGAPGPRLRAAATLPARPPRPPPPAGPASRHRHHLPQRKGREGATASQVSGRRGDEVPQPFRSSQAPA